MPERTVFRYLRGFVRVGFDVERYQERFG